ncbi:MAG: hypothetical protein HPY75_03775 [Actinobacteria bacterium]|nr:hypothetical protein [Actinomycetota bacterium]
MKRERRKTRRTLKLVSPAVLLVAVALVAASCGGGNASTQSAGSSSKLPPGAATSESSGASTSTSAASGVAESATASSSDTTSGSATGTSTSSSNSSQNTAGITKTAYLSGANFTVVSVSREDSNATVAGTNTREVAGDFLYVELSITNVSGELVDLSDFSFRLWNSAIDADLYEDYYGSDGAYGGYVSANMISASLLDLSTLQSVSYKLRIGETAEDVFLFFDLNPLSTAKNEGVTMDGTNLVIYDTETGDKAEINLSGFAG